VRVRGGHIGEACEQATDDGEVLVERAAVVGAERVLEQRVPGGRFVDPRGHLERRLPLHPPAETVRFPGSVIAPRQHVPEPAGQLGGPHQIGTDEQRRRGAPGKDLACEPVHTDHAGLAAVPGVNRAGLWRADASGERARLVRRFPVRDRDRHDRVDRRQRDTAGVDGRLSCDVDEQVDRLHGTRRIRMPIAALRDADDDRSAEILAHEDHHTTYCSQILVQEDSGFAIITS